MLGASKILTVSYGTFSCTLEGFDEPFSTMKAIAEYFRDLAAEDRYFGAEPPTPDAAMLHRIAEREIQRRVEAKVQENGVILRAGDEGSPFGAAKPAAPPLLDAAPAPAESAADKLRRLRGEAAALPVAAEAVAPPPMLAVSAPELAAEYDEDEALADLAAPLVFSEEPASDHEDAPEADFGFDGDLDLEAPSASLADELAAPLDDAAVDDAADPSDAEDVFEEIAEIAAEPEISEEGDDAMLAALAAMDAPVAPSDAADILPEDMAAEDQDDDQDWDDSEDGTAAMLAALVEPQADLAPEAAPLALDDMIDPEEFGAGDEDDDAAFAEEEAEASTGTETIEAAELMAAVSAPVAEAEEDPAEADAAPAPASEKAQRARARVIRIRRSDAPAAAPAAPAPAVEDLPRTSLLSPEAEAALQAELAALEAEIALPEAEAVPAARQPQAAAPAPQPAAAAAVDAEPRRRLDSGADDSVSRLIARTDTEMEGEDTRRRRSAIEHLKAAVAATTAERQIQGAAPERGEDRKDAYRADLAQAVRPQRPEGERLSPLVLVSEQRIDRPRATTSTAALSVASDNATEAPALVAVPGAAPAAAPGPVRPRRVKAGRHAAAAQAMADLPAEAAAPQPDVAEARAPLIESPPEAELDSFDIDEEADDAEEGNVFSDSKSFGDFAERLGATQLPDLIEAAAVYCAMVLKRPEFSRPLVLRQVSDLPAGAGLAREDCLRSFGYLMRKGRIVKVRAGHFAVTERSPLLAEALRNAG
ncbi:hypothetical protein MASR2M74_17920 [Paracoccaceae bacterium]